MVQRLARGPFKGFQTRINIGFLNVFNILQKAGVGWRRLEMDSVNASTSTMHLRRLAQPFSGRFRGLENCPASGRVHLRPRTSTRWRLHGVSIASAWPLGSLQMSWLTWPV